MILVKIIAKLILFFYPNKSKWNKKCIPKNNNKILYVVNHVTFGNFILYFIFIYLFMYLLIYLFLIYIY